VWNCQDISYSKADERENFKFFDVYHEVTDMIEKRRKLPNYWGRISREWLSYFFCFLVVLAMIIYQVMIDSTKGTWENGELIVPPTFEQTITGYIYTSVYSIIVIVFGAIYKYIALVQTQKENYRY